MSTGYRLFVLAVPVVLICEPLRIQAEASMLRHMLGVFPLLFASGFICAGAIGERVRAVFAHWNSHGICGLVFVSAVLTVWMIPNALDMAATRLPVDLAKTASVFAAGLVFSLSMSRASSVIQLFFVGQWATMTIFVGVLFQSLPSRLCASYLQTDQVRTGVGLVTFAAIIGGTWALGTWRTQARQYQRLRGSCQKCTESEV